MAKNGQNGQKMAKMSKIGPQSTWFKDGLTAWHFIWDGCNGWFQKLAGFFK